MVAFCHIIGVICATTTAMRADNVPVVLELKVGARVKLRKRHCNLEIDRWSSLLLLLAEHVAEHASEWIHLLLFGLIGTFLAASVILASFIVVSNYFIGCSDIVELCLRGLVTCVPVWMVLQS